MLESEKLGFFFFFSLWGLLKDRIGVLGQLGVAKSIAESVEESTIEVVLGWVRLKFLSHGSKKERDREKEKEIEKERREKKLCSVFFYCFVGFVFVYFFPFFKIFFLRLLWVAFLLVRSIISFSWGFFKNKNKKRMGKPCMSQNRVGG